MLTIAMRVVGLGYAAVVAVFVAYAFQPYAADFILVIAGFIVLFGVIGLASVLWAGSTRRPWFWLLAMVPGLLALLSGGSYGPYALTHPADTVAFVTTLLSLMGGLMIVFGSVTAWLEVRRGRSLWSSSGRAGPILAGTDRPRHRRLPDRLRRRVLDQRRDRRGRSARLHRGAHDRGHQVLRRPRGDDRCGPRRLRHEQGRLPPRLRHRCPGDPCPAAGRRDHVRRRQAEQRRVTRVLLRRARPPRRRHGRRDRRPVGRVR